MHLRLRSWLLASAAPALALVSPASAVDIDNARTTPIDTATANAGAPDDIALISGGSIVLSNGVAITVNSDNSVTNGGTITITGANDAMGVRVLGGFTGTITNNGTIQINETDTRTDVDSDGTLDGPFARGSGRRGVLIEGPAAHTGDVRNTGTVTVIGNTSVGIDVQSALNGSFVQSTTGQTSILGSDSVAVNIAGDVIGGDVRLRGQTRAVGENTAGVVVSGDVDGAVVIGGSVSATGYQFTSVSNYYDPDDVPAGFEPLPLDEDDLRIGGPAVAIAGNVGNGVLINGPVGGGDADDPSDPSITDPKDISGEFDENRRTGSVDQRGSAPAVLIAPDYPGAADSDIFIGVVVESVRDTLDDDGDDDLEEVLMTFFEDYGFINRGSIVANGLNSGVAANAVVIRGSQDGVYETTIQNGLSNTGTISATAAEADATTLRIGLGANVATIANSGTLISETRTETDHAVRVLLIEAGAMVGALDNSGFISASARGDAAHVVAIQDLSGTLVDITNTGQIVATYTFDGDDDDGDGVAAELDEYIRTPVAIDLSGHGVGQDATVTQASVVDGTTQRIAGSVLFGAGDDELNVLAGSVTGDVSFGDGADTLIIDNGASVEGAVSDSDGQLDITVTDGSLALTAREDVTVTSVSLADNAATAFSVDLRGDTPAAARILASGGVDIADGATIAPRITGLGPQETTFVEIIRTSGGLTLAGGHDIADNLALDSPFLFEAGLSSTTDGADDVVLVSIRRRSADELGMTTNQAAAYEPVVAALNSDDELLLAMVNLAEADDFFGAYEQLLPEYSLSALQFAVTSADGAIGAVGNRLDVVRGGRTGAGGAWLQEFGSYMDRESSPTDPGFRGNGFGIAAGVDRPLGPFYAVGVNFVGAASEIEQPAGLDAPLSVTSAQLGAYAAANAGNLLFDIYAGVGADYFDSTRRVFAGDVARQTTAEWNGYHASAAARLAYDIHAGRWFARPAVSVDYLRLEEDSYIESGGGPAVDLALDERSSELSAATASLTFGARFGSEARTWWSPRVRVGYRSSQLGSAPFTTARFASGGDSFVLRADDLPDSGGVVGFTFAAGSRYSSFALDYDADVRDGFVRHGLRVAFRFVF